MLHLSGDIIAYENGELDEEQVIALFQSLLDTGFIYHLQGSYQRQAQRLLDAGLITQPDRSVCR